MRLTATTPEEWAAALDIDEVCNPTKTAIAWAEIPDVEERRRAALAALEDE